MLAEKSSSSALTPPLKYYSLARRNVPSPNVAEPSDEADDEEVVAPTKRRGKRKPLPADLPHIEVVHELPEHELTCACGCRKHAIGEQVSEQLEIVPMQIRVIKHVRKVYGCRGCESAPVTADKPAQMIEKSMASPCVLAMLLTTKYVDGLPLHRFEKVLGRRGIDIPRQILARWVIQCSEYFQSLLNLMQQKTQHPVQFEITEQTRMALEAWMHQAHLRSEDCLFPSRLLGSDQLSTRQYARIVKAWVTAIGLDPALDGTHTLRRTKA